MRHRCGSVCCLSILCRAVLIVWAASVPNPCLGGPATPIGKGPYVTAGVVSSRIEVPGSVGGDGGYVTIKTGVNRDLHAGARGALTAAYVELSPAEQHDYVFVCHSGEKLMQLVVTGDVVIHCQYVFCAKVTAHPSCSRPPNVTIYAGQPLSYDLQHDSTLGIDMLTRMFHYVDADLTIPAMYPDSTRGELEGETFDGGRLVFETTAYGPVSVGHINAAGGSSWMDNNGGDGGDVAIMASRGDVEINEINVSGGTAGFQGVRGGQSGDIAVLGDRVTVYEQLVANGGDAPLPPGRGGDGGWIECDATSYDLGQPGEVTGVFNARGGWAALPGDGGNVALHSLVFDPDTIDVDGGQGFHPEIGDFVHGADGSAHSGPPVSILFPKYERDAWTVMVYLSADHELEDDFVGQLNQFERANVVAAGVNIVAQIDRYPTATRRIPRGTAWGAWHNTRRGFVIFDRHLDEVSSLLLPVDMEGPSELIMSDAGPLVDFVVWSAANAPAQRYCLILGGHGGSFRGILREANGNELLMSELRTALEQLGTLGRIGQLGSKFDVVVFDTCGTQTIEVATELYGHADFMVGTQASAAGAFRGSVVHYGEIMAWLASNRMVASESLARQFVANNDNPVYSALHLWSLPDLNIAVDDLGSAILDHRSDSEAMDLIRDKRPPDIIPDYFGDVDLKELMESIEGASSTPDDIRTKAELVLPALDAVVIANKEYGGLSIYTGLYDYKGINDLVLYAGHECLFLQPEAKPLGTCWREALLAIRQ